MTLLFAEIFGPSKRGDRLYDVRVEGKTVLEGYEPMHAGFAVADGRTLDIRVGDGVLDIEFVQRSRASPKISAIEIERRTD